MKFYIEYLNKDNNYQRDRKYFDTFKDAVQWGRDNFENFNLDMIRS